MSDTEFKWYVFFGIVAVCCWLQMCYLELIRIRRQIKNNKSDATERTDNK